MLCYPLFPWELVSEYHSPPSVVCRSDCGTDVPYHIRMFDLRELKMDYGVVGHVFSACSQPPDRRYKLPVDRTTFVFVIVINFYFIE